MTKEFSNTDGELARCIKARMRHELAAYPRNAESMAIVRGYIIELTQEIINEEF